MSLGSYGQAILEINPTNTTTPRVLGVIYLRALDTLQGRFEITNLIIGNIISRHKVITIQITQYFLYRVEYLAKKYGNKFPLKFKYRK